MNAQRPGAGQAMRMANRTRNVSPVAGARMRCDAGGQAGGEAFTTAFHAVNTEIHYGVRNKVRTRLPIIVGTLGPAEIARQSWEPFAVGAAISGLAVVCGENVCGLDPELRLDSRGKIEKAPDMARCVEQYRRYHAGYGDMIVQMSVEDLRLGAPEYAIGRLGIECIEFAWGRDTRWFDDEIHVDSLKRASELRRRGYLVTPDPASPASQAAFRAGVLKGFERHSRLGFIDRDGFLKQVERVRELGAKRVTLRTGACSTRDLAVAIQWASEAQLDLLTIDGSLGGIGMSPWRVVEEWGASTFPLQPTIHDLCGKLAARGEFVPDSALVGGFDSAEHVFKVLAAGAPYTKAVCMDRILTVPDITGAEIGGWRDRMLGWFADAAREPAEEPRCITPVRVASFVKVAAAVFTKGLQGGFAGAASWVTGEYPADFLEEGLGHG